MSVYQQNSFEKDFEESFFAFLRGLEKATQIIGNLQIAEHAKNLLPEEKPMMSELSNKLKDKIDTIDNMSMNYADKIQKELELIQETRDHNINKYEYSTNMADRRILKKSDREIGKIDLDVDPSNKSKIDILTQCKDKLGLIIENMKLHRNAMYQMRNDITHKMRNKELSNKEENSIIGFFNRLSNKVDVKNMKNNMQEKFSKVQQDMNLPKEEKTANPRELLEKVSQVIKPIPPLYLDNDKIEKKEIEDKSIDEK